MLVRERKVKKLIDRATELSATVRGADLKAEVDDYFWFELHPSLDRMESVPLKQVVALLLDVLGYSLSVTTVNGEREVYFVEDDD